MTRAEIINKVLVKLDEAGYGSNDQTPITEVAGITTQPVVYPTIEAELDNCVRLLLELLPVRLLTVPTPVQIESTNDPSEDFAYIDCPTDYVKLVRVKMNDWKRSVNTVIHEGSTEHDAQVYKWLQGTLLRPTAVEVKTATGYGLQLRPLTLYVKKYPVTLQYIKLVAVTALESYQVDLLAWLVAARVLTIAGESDLAKGCMEHFNLSIQAAAQ